MGPHHNSRALQSYIEKGVDTERGKKLGLVM